MLGHRASHICLGSCVSLRGYREGAKLILFISFPAVLRVEKNRAQKVSLLSTLSTKEKTASPEFVPVFAPVPPADSSRTDRPAESICATQHPLANPPSAPSTPDPAQQSCIWLGIWNSEPMLTHGKISSIQVMSKSEGWLFLLVCLIICSKLY